MVEAVKSLGELSSAIAGVDRSLSNLEQTKLESLAGSKGWTALSRLVSGVFPGFWSIQNKVRGTIDILRIIEKRGEKSFENAKKASEQIAIITKNYSDIQKTAKEFEDDLQLIKINEVGLIKIKRELEQIEALQVNAAKHADLGFKYTSADAEKFKELLEKKKGWEDDLAKLKEAAAGKELERMDRLFGKRISQEQKIKMIKSKTGTLGQMALSDVVKMGGKETEMRDELKARITKLDDKRLMKGLKSGEKEELEKLKELFKASEKRDKQFIKRFKARKFAENMKRLGLMAAKFLAFFVVASIAFAVLLKFFREFGGSIFEEIKMIWNMFIKPAFKLVGDIFALAIGAFSDAWSYFEDEKYLEALAALFAGASLIIIGVLAAAGAAIMSVLVLIWAFIGGVFKQKLEETGNWITALLSTVVNIAQVIAAVLLVIGIIASFTWVPMLIAGIVLALTAAIQALVPGFASGGVSSGGLAVVGERGPELVNLPNGSRVHSNADSRQMVGGGGNTVNVYVQGRVGASDQEIRELAKKVGEQISREINRFTSGGVFNRG